MTDQTGVCRGVCGYSLAAWSHCTLFNEGEQGGRSCIMALRLSNQSLQVYQHVCRAACRRLRGFNGLKEKLVIQCNAYSIITIVLI